MVLPNRHVEIVIDRGVSAACRWRLRLWPGYRQGGDGDRRRAGAERRLGGDRDPQRRSSRADRCLAGELAKEGLVSFHFVNTSGFGILVAPHGGRDRRLSANPIAAGAPVDGGPPIVLDIATSIIAEGKIQMARNKGEKLAPGQVLDGEGHPTTDPEAFYGKPPGAIFPFGGHKGSGLSLFCEILAGSLTGGFSSHPTTPTAGRLVNNMLSIVLDPAAFGGADFFRADVERLVAWTKASPPLEPGGTVLLPGEIELRTRREREASGIPIDPESWSQIVAAAASVGLAPPRGLAA